MHSMTQEQEIFGKHVAHKRLKHSQKRDLVLKIFLKTDQHISAEDLFRLVKEKYPDISYTTVYRTLKLIVDSGIADVVDFQDGVKRYERKVGREYHAHFICTKCNTNFEVFDDKIQHLSSRLAKEQNFLPQNHRLEIFGLCKKCS